VEAAASCDETPPENLPRTFREPSGTRRRCTWVCGGTFPRHVRDGPAASRRLGRCLRDPTLAVDPTLALPRRLTAGDWQVQDCRAADKGQRPLQGLRVCRLHQKGRRPQGHRAVQRRPPRRPPAADQPRHRLPLGRRHRRRLEHSGRGCGRQAADSGGQGQRVERRLRELQAAERQAARLRTRRQGRQGRARQGRARRARAGARADTEGGGLGRRLGRVPLGRLRRGLAAPSRGNRTHLTTEWPHTLFRVAALRDVCAGHRVSGGWRGTKDKGASGRREKRKVNILILSSCACRE